MIFHNAECRKLPPFIICAFLTELTSAWAPVVASPHGNPQPVLDPPTSQVTTYSPHDTQVSTSPFLLRRILYRLTPYPGTRSPSLTQGFGNLLGQQSNPAGRRGRQSVPASAQGSSTNTGRTRRTPSGGGNRRIQGYILAMRNPRTGSLSALRFITAGGQRRSGGGGGGRGGGGGQRATQRFTTNGGNIQTSTQTIITDNPNPNGGGNGYYPNMPFMDEHGKTYVRTYSMDYVSGLLENSPKNQIFVESEKRTLRDELEDQMLTPASTQRVVTPYVVQGAEDTILDEYTT